MIDRSTSVTAPQRPHRGSTLELSASGTREHGSDCGPSMPRRPRAPTWVRAALEGRAVEPGPVALRPGLVIPGTRYRIVRWLGEGGMGVVYEAEHIDMERRAAVKVLRAEVCDRPHVVRAFRDEARAASRIPSDFVVQLYDFAALPDERLMIAMELLEGRPLHEEVDGPMEPSRAVGILRQVCRGLAAAHAAGVVHRDIKPENVFLTTKDGRPDAVTLLDFGIAAIHDGTEIAAIRGGTPCYLAPEIGTDGSVAPGVDIYAWGCMAFELLTGEVPFTGDSVVEILYAHLSEPPPVPSSRCPGIPAALDALILRCLAKDPDARFASMVEVEAALCEAQLEHGLRTPWDDLSVPEVEPERRERLAALLPDAPTPAKQRRAMAALGVGAALLMLSSGVALAALTASEPVAAASVEASSWVEERGLQARAAAAKALFVYPPVEEPDHDTAYTVLRSLERREGDDREPALALAADLRDEFASTLVRLGDDYWLEEGGQPFATAYYEQALLFDPRRARARERVSSSEEELATLAERAETLAFSESELLGAEPLVVLAAPDAASRSKELTGLRSKRARRAASLDRTLARLGGVSVGTLLDPREVDAVHPEPEAVAPAEAEAEADGRDATERAEPSDRLDAPALDEAPADRARAAALAREGETALARGELASAQARFEQALAHDRRNVAALAGLRDVAFERSAYERAVKLGKRVVRARPRNAEHRLRLGDAYLKVLRHRDALAQYERALALGESRAGWRIEKVRRVLGPSGRPDAPGEPR